MQSKLEKPQQGEVPVRKEGIFNSLNKTFHYTIIFESYINNKKILLEGL